MSTFPERLEILVGGNRRRSAFARETGVPVSTIRDYLEGSVPSLDRVVQIARAKGVSLEWLATGDGSRDGGIVGRQEQGQLIGRSGGVDVPPEGYVSVPRFDVRASAGPGKAVVPSDLEPTSDIALRSTWLRMLGVLPEHAQFLVAEGDSMLETIHDGDLLLVNRLIDRVVSNAIYVVVLAGQVMVKRLQLLFDGSIMLISDNSHYKPEKIGKAEVESLQVEGRVRWYGRAI